MSNFSFSPSVFKSLVLKTRKNMGSSGKGLRVNFVKISPCFIDTLEESLFEGSIVEKEIILTSIFFFHNFFCP